MTGAGPVVWLLGGCAGSPSEVVGPVIEVVDGVVRVVERGLS